ncbi:MAG: GNAT family N-acetyltransferase [Candidatus Woesearchaeota archaeon]
MIRKTKLSDSYFLIKVHRESVRVIAKNHYSKAAIRGWTSKKPYNFKKFVRASNSYVYEKDKKILGFVNFSKNKIWGLYIHPSVKGKGIGKRLLTFALNKIKGYKQIELESSLVAVEFYKSQGFKIIETRKIKLGGVETEAFFMKKDLLH